MNKLPKIITSCAIRGSKHGDIHGGLYILDLNCDKYEKIFDCSSDIDLVGRGAERGLRGIVITDKYIIAAASSSILFFDKKSLKYSHSVTNNCLKYCHEMCLYNNTLWIISTGFDAIVCFDLNSNKFTKGFEIIQNKVKIFDPNKKQLNPKDRKHLNNISSHNNNIYISGTNSGGLMQLTDNKINKYCSIPPGTHNSQIFKNNIIMNNTPNKSIEIRSKNGKILCKHIVKTISKNKLINVSSDKIAKQPFPRGLAIYNNFVIAGSSPGMISVYHADNLNKIKDIIMNNDIRCSIHGIEILNG